MIVEAMARQINSGAKVYPIYITFMSAADILSIAEVPAFGSGTTNDTIATNVLTPPIREWQRPMDVPRVEGIAMTFNNTGELMPNPVLLAENVAGNSPGVSVASKMVGGLQSGLMEISFKTPTKGQSKSLWVLDGQHRIHGLAKSLQGNNLVPVVLLLNHGGSYYDGPLLAKIFAQVTTTAHKLDDLHNEWLTFAFNLGRYAPKSHASAQHRQAMEAVAALCRTPQFGGASNPFFNKIKFNSHVQMQAPAPGGFVYSCIELQRLIFEQYYNLPVGGAGLSHVPPAILAEQIADAHAHLAAIVQNPAQSVFFGTSPGESQKIMQDAFLAGVFASILKHGPPASWASELALLQFGTTNWRFNWVRSLNGEAATTSRALAFSVFSYCFESRTLPVGGGNLADFLKGNNASVKAEFSKINAAGRVMLAGRQTAQLLRGSVTSHTITPRSHLRVRPESLNVGKLTVTDKNSPPGKLTTYREVRGGMHLGQSHSNPLSLLINMDHYGGNSSSAEVDINW